MVELVIMEIGVVKSLFYSAVSIATKRFDIGNAIMAVNVIFIKHLTRMATGIQNVLTGVN